MTIKLIKYAITVFTVALLNVGVMQPSLAQDDEGTQLLTEYFKNFGLYFGYDVVQPPATKPTIDTPDIDTLTATQAHNVVDLIAGIPLLSTGNFTAIPASLKEYANLSINTFINQYANGVYDGYTTPSSTDQSATAANITVDPAIDQSTAYQSDPTSQAVLNLLTTPDITFCTNDHTTNLLDSSGNPNFPKDTPCLYGDLVMQNVLGLPSLNVTDLPAIDKITSASYNAPLVPQLNANTLMAPLMYNNAVISGVNIPTGLAGKSQAQLAAAFVRNITGQTIPLALANYDSYKSALNAVGGHDQAATSSYLSYLTALRSYAAQASVGFSIIYKIMEHRMPNKYTHTSQAYDEYVMATRRLFDPNSGDADPANSKSQWITQMEKAAPITLMREQTFLLAEMNYQLYLQRRQDEQLLLAIAALQLQSASQNRSLITIQNSGTATMGTPSS